MQKHNQRMTLYLLALLLLTELALPIPSVHADTVFMRDNEIWLNAQGGKCIQITRDGREKSSAVISPDDEKIAFIVNDKVKGGVVSKVAVVDKTGKAIWSGEVKSASGESCPSINMIEWIDNKRLGAETHVNPSLSAYHQIENGKTSSSIYTSGPHAWSPFRNSFAYAGPYPHFSANSPITSDYLVIDDSIVYDPGRRHASYFAELSGKKVGEVKWTEEHKKHEFLGNLSWSGNGKLVALCDKITDAYFVRGKTDWETATKNGPVEYYLIVTGAKQPLQQFKIQASEGQIKEQDLRVNWLKNGSVTVSSNKHYFNFKPKLN